MPKKNNKKNTTLWEVLNIYANICGEFDDVLESYALLQFEMSAGLHDISEDLDKIRNKLAECDKIFKRYNVHRPASFFYDKFPPNEDLPF